EVAIKILQSALASEPDRLARFEREAKLLATLNHAHIGALYGLDEHEGTQFLAMELIEGETLEEKLKAGRLPVEDALRLAVQIAEALEAAHAKGVMHRDLKPANIMVTRDGIVKVLDFGLAKAFSGDPNEASPAHSPALSMAMTQQGLILGTAGYMSPEQASGQATDQRADIWAFGVVLFEMLSGLPLFGGESVPHILADVLRTDPNWSRLPANLHPRLKLLLERCLEKKVRMRYHSISDARIDIEAVLNDPEGAQAEVAGAAPAGWRGRSVAAAVLGGALIAGMLVWTLTRPALLPPPPVSRYLVTPPATAPLASLGGLDLAISPDGKRLAYFGRNVATGNVALYLRDFDGLETRVVQGTESTRTDNNALNPFFSADSNWIGFRSPGEGIMRVSVNGGAPVRMLDDVELFLGADWGDDNTLIFSSGYGLQRASTGGGGTPEQITSAAEANGPFYIGPRILPGGRAVLFTLLAANRQQVAVLDLETGEERILIEGGKDVWYADTGHIVFARGTALMAAPFDLDQLVVTGEPVLLLQGVRHPVANAAADFAISENGTLLYIPGTAETTATGRVVWVDRDGQGTEPAISQTIDYPRDPRLSPDGRRMMLTTGGANDGDLWIYDLQGRPPIPLTDAGDSRLATWSPDGSRVAFLSSRNGTGYQIYVVPADGSVPDPQPLRSDALAVRPNVWTDQDELIVTGGAGADILAIPTDSETAPREVVVTADNEFDPALSPNGRWLAYASNRTGAPEVWVKEYPEGVPVRVSPAGGYEPRWSADGRELYYLQGNTLMAMAVETETEFSFERAEVLFSEAFFALVAGGIDSYDVAPDGRFLMIEQFGSAIGDADSASIVVVENWFEELKRLVPTD
ncbi:MAG: protein kinase, partial [Gammaproteobacteria bacterium]